MRSVLFFLIICRVSYCGDEPFKEKICKDALYFGASSSFGAVSQAARFGFALCHILPQTAITRNECLAFSNICARTAKIARKGPQALPDWRGTWNKNRDLLSQVPITSQNDAALVQFLEKRWLSKVAGFSRIGLDWVYPCFGITLQANPMSNHSYARLISTYMADVYKKRMESWRVSFANAYPLILTRPTNIGEFLPTSLARSNALAVIDLTDGTASQWETYFPQFKGLDVNRIIAVERVSEEGIGGLRILPLPGQSPDAPSKQYAYLLEWISTLGLGAGRVELDREPALQRSSQAVLSTEAPDRKAFLTTLASLQFDRIPSHTKILIDGTLQVLTGLFTDITEEAWQKVLASPARSSVVSLSMNHIVEQLQALSDKPLFETALELEQVHAELSALLEVLTPYSLDDFSSIYRDQFPMIDSLKPVTTYGIHSMGMSCFAAVAKAVERNLGPVHAIYGEYTYYECLNAFRKLCTTFSRADEASPEDWERANFLFVQCNPAVRTDFQHERYESEKIEALIAKILSFDRKDPLTLALDTTLDYVVSPRVKGLLEEFSQEILDGKLNVVVFRSGNKFDLLGMDNYCGAPFFICHNNRFSFDFFATDQALQCDRLSLNWFCLAYRHALPQLEAYKKQIFANTRALLDLVPDTLSVNNPHYRVIPIAVEENSSFLDIKVAGPMQKFKAVGLVLPLFFLESMEGGHPMFNRPSLGFYHPNITVIFGEECSTIRVTLGLDPAQVATFAKCLQMIGEL